MIARFRALLPFSFSIPKGEDLAPVEFVEEPYTVRIHPPRKAAIDPMETQATSRVPVRQSLENIRPADEQDATDAILMDGLPTIQANMIQIDFVKDDFDRRRWQADIIPEDQGDPTIKFVFSVANDFLARLRVLTRSGQIKPMEPKKAFWRLDYLTDNQERLPRDPRLIRTRLAAGLKFTTIGVNRNIWARLEGIPRGFEQATWDSLLLDAKELLPEVGVSIVVAYTALETFITWCVEQLALGANLPPSLWEWIKDRNDNFEKQPSVKEGLDDLLQAFTEGSLKDEPRLWEAFQNPRKARNSFVHEGKALIGNNEVTSETAKTLVTQASEIIEWTERLIPEALRRPRLDGLIRFDFHRPA